MFKKNEITRPGIFFLFAGAYLVLGIAAILDPAMLAVNPTLAISPLTILVWLFGLFLLFLGFRLGGRVFRLGPLPLAAAFILGCAMLNYMLNMGWPASIALNILALLGCWIALSLPSLIKGPFKPFLNRVSPKLVKRVHWEWLFLAGLLVFLVNMALAGIPVLDPRLHNDMLAVINLPFVFGFYLMLYSNVRFYSEPQGDTPLSSKFLLIPPSYKKKNISRIFFLVLFVLAILSSFRSYIGIVFLAWAFLELAGKRPGRISWKRILPLAGLLVLALASAIIIGHSLAVSDGSEWGLGPMGTMEYRLGFTNHVFDDVVARSFPLGYSFGASLESPFGLYTCQALYGCDGRLTSGLLGEIMLDFGLLGIGIVMLFTGSVLGGLYKRDYPLYALLMAHLIVALEISAGYFFILLVAYLGYLGACKGCRGCRVLGSLANY